jgi:preprotein translocase SecE subunit
MAVAVKNPPETRAPSVLDRLAAVSLAGVVYLIGMLWLVFGGLPLLWQQIGLTTSSFLGVAGLGLVMLVAFCVLAVVGVRLFSARAQPGLRAGIFCGLLLLLLLLGICRWIGGFIEARVYNNDWFTGTEGQWGGLIAGVLCLLVCLWFLRLFFRRGFENFLVRFEEQGWFSAKTYKPGQGQRVRRGTILGVLLLGGSGIWVMLNHSLLGTGNSRWDVNIPFTGRVIVKDSGDATEKELQKDSGNQLRVIDAGDTALKEGTNVSRNKVLETLEPLAQAKLMGLDHGLYKPLWSALLLADDVIEVYLPKPLWEKLKVVRDKMNDLSRFLKDLSEFSGGKLFQLLVGLLRHTLPEEYNKLSLRDAELLLTGRGVLDKLAEREKDLRASLQAIQQQTARTATEEAADLLKGWRERLEPFRDQLQKFVEAKNEEDKLASEANLFLMQGEIDKVVKQEQEGEKGRERLKATQRVPLTEELGWISSWAQAGRLPVLAPIIDRFRVRDINKGLDPDTRRIVRNEEAFADLPERERKKFKKGEIVDASDLDTAIDTVQKQLRDRGETDKLKEVETAMSEAAPKVKPVEGQTVYASIVLLPAVRFTVPLLLLALTLWLAWRIVNLPTFADFLVATEAEMNKVSWTTRHRLYQDTVVVLVTMILLAMFLFLADIGWHAILSWKPIGVLRTGPEKTQKTDEDLKW